MDIIIILKRIQVKKVKYQLVIILTFLCCNNLLKAQDLNHELGIGDSLPDVAIKGVIGHIDEKRTVDFKNKLLIIDFWATSCISCVLALPKMEKLQKQFNGKILILPITNEKTEYIKNFLNSNRYIKNLTLPIMTNDKLFHIWFKHRTVPHEVWIYQNKVIAITSGDYVDEFNIKRALLGSNITSIKKYDFYKFDRSKTLLSEHHLQKDSLNDIISYSAIFKYKEGVNTGFSGPTGYDVDTIRNKTRVFFINMPIFNAYLMYSFDQIKIENLVKPTVTITPNQLIWEVIDRNKYKFYKSKGNYAEEWMRKNAVCLEIQKTGSKFSNQQLARYATQELDRLLRMHVRWEKKREKIWVLKDNLRLKTKRHNSLLPGRNITKDEFIALMNENEENPYVFNESTNNEEKIPKVIITNNNIEKIARQLISYGYKLTAEVRLVDKFVISELDYNSKL